MNTFPDSLSLNDRSLMALVNLAGFLPRVRQHGRAFRLDAYCSRLGRPLRRPPL